MTTPPLGRVLILSAEDTPADTLGPRLHAVGADLARVFNIRAVPDLDEQGQPLSAPSLSTRISIASPV